MQFGKVLWKWRSSSRDRSVVGVQRAAESSEVKVIQQKERVVGETYEETTERERACVRQSGGVPLHYRH